MEITKEMLDESDYARLLKLIIHDLTDRLPEDAEVVAIRLQLAYTCAEFDGDVAAIGQTRSVKYNPVDLSQMFLDYARKQHASLEAEFGAKEAGLIRPPRRRPRRTPT